MQDAPALFGGSAKAGARHAAAPSTTATPLLIEDMMLLLVVVVRVGVVLEAEGKQPTYV